MAHKANSLAHTKWLCKYHIVFTPKYRRKIIYNKYREDLREILKMLCDWKGVEILEGHLMLDHIHMLVSIPPKISVSSFMGYLKGKSSLLMFDYMQTLNISMVIGNFGPQLLCVNSRPLAIWKTSSSEEERGLTLSLSKLIWTHMLCTGIHKDVRLNWKDWPRRSSGISP